jgi:hypothetical protein
MESNFGNAGQLLKQVPVTLRYEEQVNYRLERIFDLTAGTYSEQRFRNAPVRTSFETKGLLLYFEPAPQESELRALCLALRHVIPVHLGVEEDALEVVPIDGQYVERKRVSGLAIVDLYPQGIGLVDAIEEDGVALVLNLLKWIRDWLIAETDAMQKGAPNPLKSPLATCTGGEQHPASALPLLRRILGP